MNRLKCSLQYRSVAMLGLAIGIIVVASSVLPGQSWEGLYGGAGMEAGFGGVAPVSTGGFIAAGQSSSSPATGFDIYVVKTNALGTTLWSVMYDIGSPGPFGAGGDDFATDIKELPTGDFILTGYTYNSNTTYNDSIHHQIFLMKLNPSGVVQWTRTYGGIDADTGVSVIRAANGDFIVAGSTVSFGAGPTSNTPPAPNFAPDRDGFILRTDANGDVLWMRTYGGEYYDAFRSVIEVNTGEIVAAGYSENFVAPRATRPFVVRVDPAGLIGTLGYTTAAVVVNRANMAGTYLNCIRQNPGGNTFTAVGTTGVGVRDVYLITLGNNLMTGFDYRLGQATQPEDGMWLTFNPMANNNPVVVGTRANAVGVPDVWAFEINLAGPALAWSNTYGFGLADYGHSIAYVPGGGAWGAGPGFIMAGQNWGAGPLPNPQLYLIRSNITGNTGCTNVATPQNVVSLGQLSPVAISPKSYRVRVECTGLAARTLATMDDGLICGFGPPKSVVNSADELTMLSPTPGAESPIDAVSLHVYPNPIGKDASLNVEYRLLMETESTITVTDLAGKEVYRSIDHNVAGEVAKEISVGAWPAGTYLVKVTAADGNSVVKQIVVGVK